jgi:hypothetical protein
MEPLGTDRKVPSMKRDTLLYSSSSLSAGCAQPRIRFGGALGSGSAVTR